MARIIVADSADSSRKELEFVLNEYGKHQLFPVSDGEELQRAIFNRNPHLVITSGWLCGKSVIEVLKGIRSERAMAHIKVIVYTRNKDAEFKKKYESLCDKVLIRDETLRHSAVLLPALRQMALQLR